MGLRCSILGHEFGDAELHREREERGDEVVVTIREVRTCERCGAEHVESESTEVRPVEPVEEVADDGSGDDRAAAGGGDGDGETASASASASAPANADREAADADVDADADSDAEAEAEADADSGETGAGTGTAGTAGSIEEAEPPTAEEDDGVILDDDGEEVPPERREGEWPRADDTRLEERDPTAERETASGTDGTDDGSEADDAGSLPEEADATASADENGAGDVEVAESEDAEILDAESGGAAAASQNGESSAQSDARSVTTGTDWPEHEDVSDRGFDAESADGGGPDVEFGGLAPDAGRDSDSDSDSATGRPAAGSPPEDAVSLDAGDGPVFVCGACGFSEPIGHSSLRAGDICPDCQSGYIREVAPAEE
jgi:hypothetical protein